MNLSAWALHLEVFRMSDESEIQEQAKVIEFPKERIVRQTDMDREVKDTLVKLLLTAIKLIRAA